MKRLVLLALAVVFLAPAIGAAGDTCPQGQLVTYQDTWFGDTRSLTAVHVNPQGPISGEVDATGCDIGVYYGLAGAKGLVQNARIHGARRFGVLVNGMQGGLTVDVVSSSIHDIGDPTAAPYDLEQGGVAISYQTFGSGRTSGKVTGNFISRYQYAGIGIWGGEIQIADNIISGFRPSVFSESASQYGIFATGGKLAIERNTIADNVYTGPYEWWAGVGILGNFNPGSQIAQNVLVNNQNGIWIFNNDSVSPTRLTIADNRVTCDALYAQTGLQVGLWISGYRDRLVSNVVTGVGYDLTTKPGYTYPTLLNEIDPRGKPTK